MQRQLISDLISTDTQAEQKRTEATTRRQSAWAAFEAALFAPAEPGAA